MLNRHSHRPRTEGASPCLHGDAPCCSTHSRKQHRRGKHTKTDDLAPSPSWDGMRWQARAVHGRRASSTARWHRHPRASIPAIAPCLHAAEAVAAWRGRWRIGPSVVREWQNRYTSLYSARLYTIKHPPDHWSAYVRSIYHGNECQRPWQNASMPMSPLSWLGRRIMRPPPRRS